MEGEHLSEAQLAEFGHLLHWELWGINDWLTGSVVLRKPSSYVMDIFVTPAKPVEFIYVNMEITKNDRNAEH
jgi:hypothetical protein